MKSSFVAAVVTVLVAVSASARNTYYLVPAGTAGNTPTSPYTSWETAANELADVMDILPEAGDDGDTILVKPGVYYPTRQASPDAYRLNLTIRSCDPATGETDPEGTIFDGSQLPIDANGNQPRILLVSVLNWGWEIRGLTFRNVAAGGALKLMNGCSDYCIADCIFHDNVASNDHGGAVYVFCDSGTITNCVFRNNRVTNGNCAGGALALQQNNDGKLAYVQDCTFADNIGGEGGGSIKVWNGGAVISNCTFTGTCGGQYGSVVHMESSSRLVGCAFTNLTLVGGTFAAVIGVKNGGQVYEVENCSFVNCCRGVAQIFNLYGSTFNVRNTLFADTVGSDNGAAWIWDGPMTFENCTIAGFARGHSRQTLNETEQATYVNCILPSRVGCDVMTTLENTYVTSESGDPFVSLLRGDCRLVKGTACVDGGTALAWHAGAKDVGGRDRVVGAAVDIGCYERQPEDPARYYYRAVQSAADKTGNWADATVGIQEAIDAAPAGAFVGIRSGTWNVAKTITIYGKSLTVCGLNAETDEIDRDGTILDGGNARRIMQVTNRTTPVFDQDGGEGEPSGSVVATVVVEGLTFRNGDATAGTTTDGGGVIRDADGHRTSNDGGGLWLRGSTDSASYPCSRARNCRFVSNSAASGGGMYLNWGGIAEDCLFEENEAKTASGGGLCGHDWAGAGGTIAENGGWNNPYALRCTFLRNTAVRCGGGYGDSAGFCYFRIFAKDCYFEANQSSEEGGNLAGGNGSIVEGCTFVDGVCVGGGSGANLVLKEGTAMTGCTVIGGVGNPLEILSNGTQAKVTDCVVSNMAGGVFVQGAVRFRNVLMAGVQGSIYLYFHEGFTRVAGGEYVFENSTFADCANINFSYGHRDISNLSAVFLNTIADCPIVCVGRYDEKHVQALAATNSCFQTLPTGDDTFAVDAATCFARSPRFVNAAAGDYSLRHASPCRDRGRMLDWMTVDSKDLAGNPRVVTEGVPLAEDPTALPDIGCYECLLKAKGMTLLVR